MEKVNTDKILAVGQTEPSGGTARADDMSLFEVQ